jgi:hypothetical protein
MMTHLRRSGFAALSCLLAQAALAFDVNGVRLGAKEADVLAAFPDTYCKPLEWQSSAADRRCEQTRASFAGTRARLTFYLKGGVVQAFDARFDTSDYQPIAVELKQRYGKPAVESMETVQRKGREPRNLYTLRWQRGSEHAAYGAEPGKRRSQLSVWRGNFDQEIYRVR